MAEAIVDDVVPEKRRRTSGFVWRELMTPDVEAAKSFYGALFGWSFADIDVGPAERYPAIEVNGRRIGGFLQMKPGAAFPPYWGSFISVEDVSSTIERALARGSQLAFGPQDSHAAGPYAVLLDPQGAAFIPFHENGGNGSSPAAPVHGDFMGENLTTSQPEAAARFYSDLFGWKAHALGLGQITLSDGATAVARITQAPPAAPSNWATSVIVPNLDDACRMATKLGGRVLAPLIVLPKHGRVAIIADPTNVVIGVFEPT